jgi:hypothetical protein
MNKCKLHYFRSVGKFFVFFEHKVVKRRRNVALAYNYTLHETRPNNNGNNINKIRFDLAGEKCTTLQSK